MPGAFLTALFITWVASYLMAGQLGAQDSGGVAVSVAGDRSSGMIITQKGKEFTISLDSNGTTGYQWQLSESPDETVVKFVKSEYQSSDTGRVGAGGKEVWTFLALGVGETEVALKYVRIWEKGVPPAREALFRIVVRP